MNWITDTLRPRIKSLLGSKRDTPDNLWVKCPESGQMVFVKDLEANLMVVPGSGYHMRMSTEARIRSILDGDYEEIALRDVVIDPLKFRDEKRYVDRLRDARAKTKEKDAVKVVVGQIDSLPVTVAVQDFSFMGGSLGMAAAEGCDRRARNGCGTQDALHSLFSLGRCPHAGRHSISDAIAAHHGCRADAAQGWPALHRRARRIRQQAVSPPPTPCWATCTLPSRVP